MLIYVSNGGERYILLYLRRIITHLIHYASTIKLSTKPITISRHSQLDITTIYHLNFCYIFVWKIKARTCYVTIKKIAGSRIRMKALGGRALQLGPGR